MPDDLPPPSRSNPWLVGFWGIVALAVLALLILQYGAVERPERRGFDAAMREGASCAELFAIRNRETNDQTIERMNQRLRNVGCFSSSSRRTD